MRDSDTESREEIGDRKHAGFSERDGRVNVTPFLTVSPPNHAGNAAAVFTWKLSRTLTFCAVRIYGAASGAGSADTS